jgi:glutaconyl-CoA/methylmalonyl-CoA decarboxylase subunit gamma
LRITLERDGRREEIEVAPDGDSVTIGGRTYPVVRVSASDLKVELEIAGERVVIDNWPAHFPDPPGPVDVNGERWKISVERADHAPTRGDEGRPPRASESARAASPGAAAGPVGAIAVVPPMPGKILEVRVAEGDRVHRGDVLLVLEAMKMRNVVRQLTVSAGANVRAKEPMLYVAPG